MIAFLALLNLPLVAQGHSCRWWPTSKMEMPTSSTSNLTLGQIVLRFASTSVIQTHPAAQPDSSRLPPTRGRALAGQIVKDESDAALHERKGRSDLGLEPPRSSADWLHRCCRCHDSGLLDRRCEGPAVERVERARACGPADLCRGSSADDSGRVGSEGQLTVWSCGP
jgi:hypothetical protein